MVKAFLGIAVSSSSTDLLRDGLLQLLLWSLLVLSMPWVIFLPLVSVEEVDWDRLITEAENLFSVATAQCSGVFLSVERGFPPQPCSYL